MREVVILTVVKVLPLTEENGSSEVDEELFSMDDIKIEVMRSRGAGGQVCRILWQTPDY